MERLNVNTTPGFSARIEILSTKLSGTENKIAQFISDHVEEIIHLSITEVAERSHTSESTIVRLCKRLGYKGFQDLKINLAREIIKPEKQINETLERHDDVPTIKRKIFQANIQALYDSLEVCQDSELARAIDAICSARSIELYGTGGSGAVAYDAQHKFLKIGIKSNAYVDVHMQAMSASVLDPKDVVIAISHTGANKDILHSLKLAKSQGATTICITNYSKSPITRSADIVLFTSSKETMFRTDATASRIAQLTIIDTLFAGVAYNRYETAYEHIQKTRKATSDKRY